MFFFFFFEKEIPRKIKIKIDNLVRVYYLWAPESRQISHTFNVFVFSVAKGSVAYSIIIRTFLCSKPFSFSSTWTLVLSSINSMTESFLCFFLLDIFFQFVLHKGHQIAHGPQPDPKTRRLIGLIGSPACCY